MTKESVKRSVIVSHLELKIKRRCRPSYLLNVIQKFPGKTYYKHNVDGTENP